MGLYWNTEIYIIDRTSFSKWYDNGTTQGKTCNLNILFLFNGYPEDDDNLGYNYRTTSKTSILMLRSGRANYNPL